MNGLQESIRQSLWRTASGQFCVTSDLFSSSKKKFFSQKHGNKKREQKGKEMLLLGKGEEDRGVAEISAPTFHSNAMSTSVRSVQSHYSCL